MTKKKKKKIHNPITYNFTKKYFYFYYAFFWSIFITDRTIWSRYYCIINEIAKFLR